MCEKGWRDMESYEVVQTYYHTHSLEKKNPITSNGIQDCIV